MDTLSVLDVEIWNSIFVEMNPQRCDEFSAGWCEHRDPKMGATMLWPINNAN